MPTTRARRQPASTKAIDFPVQKSTRSKAKQIVSPRKRTAGTPNAEINGCSPTKKTRRGRRSLRELEVGRPDTPTPNKASRQQNEPAEDTPVKVLPHIQEETCVQSPVPSVKIKTRGTPNLVSQKQEETCLRSPVSSVKIKARGTPNRASPRITKNKQVKSDEDIHIVFTPGKQTGEVTPTKSPHSAKGVRALTFSPTRQSSRSEIQDITKACAQHLTPTKSQTTSRPYSPRPQAVSSPVRNLNKLLLSPIRELRNSPSKPPPPALLMSPPGRECLLSPTRQCASPLTPSKQSQLLESPRRLSPRKRNLFREAGPASPVKGLTSPVKRPGLLSPAKASPLCLARQQGECYQQAKQALHTALPDRIVGRESETSKVREFINSHVQRRLPGSLYISGAPGTGKTAVLSHTLNMLKSTANVTEEDNSVEMSACQTVYVNCMRFRNSQAIFNEVLGELHSKTYSLSAKEAQQRLEKAWGAKGKPVVMILDEIDQLDSKNQEVLYTMFEWPALQNSRLILIGIANALDLTDRILPRLQARPKCKPQLLHFAPYTKDQIMAVLKDRLEQLSVSGEVVLDPAAIRFCAMKVSSVAGDMRKALDICRRAVEMVEMEVRKQKILKPAQGFSSPSKSRPVPKKISVPHIMKIVNEVYGSRLTSGSSSAQQIPLQQKLAICTLLLMRKQAKTKEATLGKLHEMYSKVCKRQQVAAVSSSEFQSLCTLIEAKGIMGLKKAKDVRNMKVSLKLDDGELEQALQDKTLLASILQAGLP